MLLAYFLILKVKNMIWFKNLAIYRLSENVIDMTVLADKLAQFSLKPCGDIARQSIGFKAPINGVDELFLHKGDNLLLCVGTEQKVIPNEVINREYNDALAISEENKGKKLAKVEKESLKMQIVAKLLPQAFSKFSQNLIYINLKHNLIVVDSSSFNHSQNILSVLRQAIGTLPAKPISFNSDLASAMTDWVKNDQYPAKFIALLEAELKNEQDLSVIRAKGQELSSDEIIQHIESGKRITKLALEFDENISFILNADAMITRVKFSQELRYANDEYDDGDISRYEADLLLLANAIIDLTDSLSQHLGEA